MSSFGCSGILCWLAIPFEVHCHLFSSKFRASSILKRDCRIDVKFRYSNLQKKARKGVSEHAYTQGGSVVLQLCTYRNLSHQLTGDGPSLQDCEGRHVSFIQGSLLHSALKLRPQTFIDILETRNCCFCSIQSRFEGLIFPTSLALFELVFGEWYPIVHHLVKRISFQHLQPTTKVDWQFDYNNFTNSERWSEDEVTFGHFVGDAFV